MVLAGLQHGVIFGLADGFARLVSDFNEEETPMTDTGELHVGLDVSLAETHICILDAKGRTVCETAVATDPDAVCAVLAPFGDQVARVGLEASSIAGWLHGELSDLGYPMIQVEAYHMRTALNAQRNKTDRTDALGIAQMMRLGWFRAVHAKSDDSKQVRMLLTNRRLLKRKLIDMENHIRGVLRAQGLFMGAVGRGTFAERVLELIDGCEPAMAHFVSTMLTVRNHLLDGYNELHALVIAIARRDPLCRCFMEVPGVGPIAALSFKAGVDDPHRFKRSRTVGAHFGLTPGRWQSGTIDRDRRISKQGDREVRTALCEAAASLLLRVKSWSALKAWGLRLAQRTSMMNAIVAVACKLAVIMHRMWVDSTRFLRGKGAKVLQKRRLTPPQPA
jgi:transposase